MAREIIAHHWQVKAYSGVGETFEIIGSGTFLVLGVCN
jgi:hypothetical protein